MCSFPLPICILISIIVIIPGPKCCWELYPAQEFQNPYQFYPNTNQNPWQVDPPPRFLPGDDNPTTPLVPITMPPDPGQSTQNPLGPTPDPNNNDDSDDPQPYTGTFPPMLGDSITMDPRIWAQQPTNPSPPDPNDAGDPQPYSGTFPPAVDNSNNNGNLATTTTTQAPTESSSKIPITQNPHKQDRTQSSSTTQAPTGSSSQNPTNQNPHKHQNRSQSSTFIPIVPVTKNPINQNLEEHQNRSHGSSFLPIIPVTKIPDTPKPTEGPPFIPVIPVTKNPRQTKNPTSTTIATTTTGSSGTSAAPPNHRPVCHIPLQNWIHELSDSYLAKVYQFLSEIPHLHPGKILGEMEPELGRSDIYVQPSCYDKLVGRVKTDIFKLNIYCVVVRYFVSGCG